MASFLDELELTPYSDSEWKLIKEFDYWTDVLDPRVTFHVPIGFITDLASIPRIFWNIMPPFGKYTGAAVIHDWLYRQQTISRKMADNVLKEAMGILGVSSIQKWIIYSAVRCFGWSAWNGHKKESQ